MVEKRYVAKKRIPEYCPFGSVMSLKVESENDAPACFGRVVGYQYEGSDEVVSTIEGDNLKAKGERIIDRLMYDGYLVKHQTVKKIDNLGTVNVTQYGIMYEAESAAQHKGTPTHGIPSPTAGQFICTFELLMVTESTESFTSGTSPSVRKRLRYSGSLQPISSATWVVILPRCCAEERADSKCWIPMTIRIAALLSSMIPLARRRTSSSIAPKTCLLPLFL